jgi:hypothetical protein
MTPEALAEEENRTTSIGLCLQAQSYLQSAEHLFKAEKIKNLSLRFKDPIVFLLSHGIELSLKAWLRTKGYQLSKFKKIGHSLTRLYKECKK